MFSSSRLRRDQPSKETRRRVQKLVDHYGAVREARASRNPSLSAGTIAKRHRRRTRPQETYEKWHLNKGSEDGDLNGDESGEDDENSHIIDTFTSNFDTACDTVKAQFLIQYHGLEVIHDAHSKSFTRQHISRLETLLHLTVLRQNWRLAYKVFSVLVRLPEVDLREIWPLGAEILRHYDAGDKQDRFFKWMASFYSVRPAKLHSRVIHASAPVWRTGSAHSAPVYEVAHLWRLLERGRIKELQDRLEQIELVPPYSSDGSIHYIRMLSVLYEGNSGTIDRARVHACMEKCDSLGFEYPRERILEQMKEMERIEDSEEFHTADEGMDTQIDNTVRLPKTPGIRDDWADIDDDIDDESDRVDIDDIEDDRNSAGIDTNERNSADIDTNETNEWADIDDDIDERNSADIDTNETNERADIDTNERANIDTNERNEWADIDDIDERNDWADIDDIDERNEWADDMDERNHIDEANGENYREPNGWGDIIEIEKERNDSGTANEPNDWADIDDDIESDEGDGFPDRQPVPEDWDEISDDST